MSSSAKPLWFIASFIIAFRCSVSPAKERAAKLQSRATARAMGLNCSAMTPKGVRLGHRAFRRGRRRLPLGQAVDLVVVHEDLDAHVPADRRHQVIAAFAVAVAVPGRHDHRHAAVRDPDAGRNRQRPSVEAVEGVAFRIVRKLCRLADAGDDRDLMRFEAEFDQGILEGLEDRKVAASRTPGRNLTG